MSLTLSLECTGLITSVVVAMEIAVAVAAVVVVSTKNDEVGSVENVDVDDWDDTATAGSVVDDCGGTDVDSSGKVGVDVVSSVRAAYSCSIATAS